MTNVTFTFRTTRKIIEKLKYIAEYNGRSVNKELEQLVLRRISEFEKEQGVIENDQPTD